MSEARPSGPSQATLDGFAKARSVPGAWVPFRDNLKRHTSQWYYKDRYPDYDFMWRMGVLYVRYGEEGR